MPKARTSDGIELHYEEKDPLPLPRGGLGRRAEARGPLPLQGGGSGRGAEVSTILFIHEFAGDHRSWAPQVRHFATSYRCITYAARGYPPSDVPTEISAYSQARAVEDAVDVLQAAGVEKAHVVGLSMGGFAVLHLVLRHPDRVRSVVIAGVGYGAQPDKVDQFRKESNALADAYESEGSATVAETYALGPARVQLQNKNHRTWQEFASALAEHNATGAALTMRGVQATRPSLYDLQDELRAVRTPVLIVAGDEDEGSLEPSLMLKRTIPTSALLILPRTGHTINLEEPEAFNEAIANFIDGVDRERWPARDPRSRSTSITGAPRQS